MRKLEFEEMALFDGGTLQKNLDAFCAGVGAVGAAVAVAGPIGQGVTIACAGYGLGRLLDWW